MTGVVTMILAPHAAPLPVMSDETQQRLLQTLRTQHHQLTQSSRDLAPTLRCQLIRAGDSYCFMNDLWSQPKAYASTPVVLRGPTARTYKSVVQLKRDECGDAMASITVKGPVYKLVSGELPPHLCQHLTLHASMMLFSVYVRAMYELKQVQDVPALPLFPAVPDCVQEVKFHDKDALQQLLTALRRTAPTLPPLQRFSPPGSPRPSTPGIEDTPACYICWRQVTCDVLFPCMVASHACCRKCVTKLYERWRCTEFEGGSTIPCPMCGCAQGKVVFQDGSPLTLPSKRYMLRKQAKPSYRRTRVFQ